MSAAAASTPIPVDVTRDGVVIATVIVRIPVAIELTDALALAPKLFGDDTLPIALDRPAPPAASPQDAEEERERMAQAQRANLRARAEAMDATALQAWLRTLDPGNPHMSVAYEIVSGRLEELAAGAAPAEAPPDADVGALVEKARKMEAEWREQQTLAEAGDEQARIRANDLRSQLVALQADIADGVDRSDNAEPEA